ncbi:hypothetical protein RvY_13526-2 [Ramazzottius varieornatus]|uniref:DUF937 domain-containing protein n=1 Tax=Ramazzottius varieornatus TaxID=947166 RepID=A0A1D1VN54_RAMVA|nr:hypothetical protein RvY_13526-2 [Ramazzottius varieornatus]
MDMAMNLLGQLAPQQQDSVKSNWGELFNVMGGSKENVAMELAKQTVKTQLLGGGSGSGGSGGGMASMLGGMSKLFGKKEPAKEEAAASIPSNPMDIISKAAPFIGGLDNPNALMGFFMQGVMGSGAAKTQSESSIFSMMKQVIFGLLGDKLPAQSFSQNNQAQGAWTNFLQLAAGAMKKQAT